MKRFITILLFFIPVVTILFGLSSCDSDDDIDMSKDKGTATAIIDVENGKKAKVKWIQLWKNGPKFAEYNLGVVDGKPESFGGKYQWYSFFDENDQISNFPWGNNWRIPTKDEFEYLLNNCKIEWTKINDIPGITITGIGDYSNNSIFLPACEYDEGEVYGRYWTSTPESSSNAYNLGFHEVPSFGYKVSFNGKHRFRSIRPVLAESNNNTGSEESKQELIGTWDGTITSNGETFDASLVIKADGTYFEISGHGYNSFNGNWKDNGNGTITLTNFFDPTFKYSIQSNKLYLTGNGWSASFTRR